MEALKARPAQFDRSTQHRRAMMAKINIAKGQIGIDEDDYRQAIFNASGQMSLKACTDQQLDRLLAWFKSKGFKPMPSGAKQAAQHPMARKARALWISLYHLGAVHNPADQALEAFAKRQLGCEKLVWARQSDAYRLIEALKGMGTRHGWRQHCLATGKAHGPAGLQESLCAAILDRLIAAKVAPANWTLDEAAWKLCGIDTGATRSGYTVQDYERLAKALGAVLREQGGLPHG